GATTEFHAWSFMPPSVCVVHRAATECTLVPYTTLFRSRPPTRRPAGNGAGRRLPPAPASGSGRRRGSGCQGRPARRGRSASATRSGEHTSESSHVKSSYAVFCLKNKLPTCTPTEFPVRL